MKLEEYQEYPKGCNDYKSLIRKVWNGIFWT